MVEPKAGGLPLYTQREAARYLGIPVSTVSAWVKGRLFPKGEGLGYSPPVLREVAGGGLSFFHLVELYVLRSLRTRHGVSLQAVRKALEYAERELGVKHLLLSPELKTHGGELFLDRYGQLVNLSRSGLVALRELLIQDLRRVEWEGEWPVRLYLPVRGRPEARVSVSPRFRYGRPAVYGVETRILAARVDGGETPEALAEDYGMPLEAVMDALVFENLQLGAA